MNCPSDIIADVEIGSPGTSVSWTEPFAVDESENATLLVKTHTSGSVFGIGTAFVTYAFIDPSKNMATCQFLIIARGGKFEQLFTMFKSFQEEPNYVSLHCLLMEWFLRCLPIVLEHDTCMNPQHNHFNGGPRSKQCESAII